MIRCAARNPKTGRLMILLGLEEGNVARHTLERLGSFIDGVAGKRLTYKALIA